MPFYFYLIELFFFDFSYLQVTDGERKLDAVLEKSELKLQVQVFLKILNV